MTKSDKIFIAGHRGMVGSAIKRRFDFEGYSNILTQTRDLLDLCDYVQVLDYLKSTQPDVVIIVAGRVGGIHANNTYPADFIHENLAIAHNLVHGSFIAGVKRVLFLGSSCIYPRNAPQPMTEECLLTSPLEPTNEAYAIAKICGLKLCEFYRKQYGVLFHSAMPTNLYGPGDNYHPENSHVLPGMVRRFHEAKEEGKSSVTVWGTGNPRRELLHVDNLSDGVVHLLQEPSPPDCVNIGTGKDVSIRELAELVKSVVGYEGEIEFDTSKPDGTPQKLLDVSRMKSIGWEARIGLKEGIETTYKDFLGHLSDATLRAY